MACYGRATGITCPAHEAGFHDSKVGSVPRFGRRRFSCACLEGDTVYVVGTKETHGWYGDTLTLFLTKDLTNWTERTAFHKPGMGISNTSVCKTRDRCAMSIEQTNPGGFPATQVSPGKDRP